MSDPLDVRNLAGESNSFTVRTMVVFLIALALVLVLLGRLVQLQVFEHDSYSIRSDDNRIQVRALPPDRGLIFDRHGVLLADNRPARSLNLVTELIDDLDGVIGELRELVEISDRQIEEFRERLK
ncbi:MAG: penicillin-binding protein 2, partial [Gammaproteobacteria bacterium]|nr:penicillin-binding protein 2 [Gammaproteobacteria bacterium]